MPDVKNSRRNMWCAVIDQAIRDAISPKQSGTAIAERDQARAWLARRTPDFDEVCSLAGFEPDAVLAKAAQIIADADALQAAGQSKAPKRVRSGGPEPRRIEFNGLNLTIREWSERTGISKDTITNRFRLGWDTERALTQPAQPGWAWRNKHQISFPVNQKPQSPPTTH